MLKKLMKNRVAKNAIWIIVGKLTQSLIALIVTMLTARYLGPGRFGLINYAASIVAFVSPIAFLGLNNILVQEFTIHPEDSGEILGSAVMASLCSALVCILGIISFVYLANPGEPVTLIVCVLYSMILLFQVLALIEYWFQSKLLSKYSTIVTLAAYIVVSVYKITLLVTKMQIYWFAMANTLDYLIISSGLLFVYKKVNGGKIKFSVNTAKRLVKKSSPYIITGLMIAIFAQTDKIMIKAMLDDASTGLYSAAVTCATMTGFVYVAIIDSFRPSIFQSFKESEDQFDVNMKRLYSLIIYISLMQSIVMTVFSKIIVFILYGNEYSLASDALKIITWFTTFSYLGSVRGIWILSHDLQKYLLPINLSGAVLNVIANYLLIPIFGINGAAFASFATQFFTNFFIGFIIKPIRKNNKLIMESINPKYILSLIKEL